MIHFKFGFEAERQNSLPANIVALVGSPNVEVEVEVSRSCLFNMAINLAYGSEVEDGAGWSWLRLSAYCAVAATFFSLSTCAFPLYLCNLKHLSIVCPDRLQ